MSHELADKARDGLTIRSPPFTLHSLTGSAWRPAGGQRRQETHEPRHMTRDPRLTLNARQQELLEWVQRDGFVTVDDLAAHFDVTPQTIRRRVNWLADIQPLRRS